MCLAQHSINILAWELSLSFGLVETGKIDKKWITMEDVLLSRAKHGVKIRIIVWRHSMMTMLNRIRYMGPVEQEVEHFNERARRLGISFKVFHTTRGMVIYIFRNELFFHSLIHLCSLVLVVSMQILIIGIKQKLL